MNWDDLKIFLYVSRRKTLAKAAQELKLDETTISRRLKRLEQNLGQTLFERLRSGHTLTSHGEALLTKAEAIERETDDISRVKVKGVRKPSGTLRISVSEGFGAYVLAPVLQEFNSALNTFLRSFSVNINCICMDPRITWIITTQSLKLTI